MTERKLLNAFELGGIPFIISHTGNDIELIINKKKNSMPLSIDDLETLTRVFYNAEIDMYKNLLKDKESVHS